MKTVASLSDLQRQAMGSGAVVSIGGRTINTAARTLPAAAKTVEEPAPAPVAPAPALDVEGLLERLGDKIADAIRMPQGPSNPPILPPPPPPPAPAPQQAPKRTFAVETDERGLITRVVGMADNVDPLIFTIKRGPKDVPTEIVQE